MQLPKLEFFQDTKLITHWKWDNTAAEQSSEVQNPPVPLAWLKVSGKTKTEANWSFNSHKCLSAFLSLRKTISECWHRSLKIILAKDKQSSRYRNIFYTEKKNKEKHTETKSSYFLARSSRLTSYPKWAYCRITLFSPQAQFTNWVQQTPGWLLNFSPPIKLHNLLPFCQWTLFT